MTMDVPRQVAQQLQEVSELEEQLYEPPKSEAEPLAPEPVEKKPEPDTPVEKKSELDQQEQRYKTLQGMFQAETSRRDQRIAQLEEQLQTAMQQLSKAAQPAAPKEQPLVTDKDREEYGDDMLGMVERVTRQVIRDHVVPLTAELEKRDQRIAQLESAVQKTSGDVSSISFDQQLRLLVPDFDAVQRDQRWANWLDSVDPFTGEPRRMFAEYVYQSGNAEQVARVVGVFKQTLEPEGKHQTELSKQVQPPRSHANAAVSTQSKPVYASRQLDAMWAKVRQLNIEGKNDEAAKLEAELSQAYVDGRVTP